MKVSYNGNVVTLSPDIVIQNVQPYPNTNVTVTFTIPAGLTYSTSTPSQGSYNPNTKVWTIGTIEGNKTASLRSFKLIVNNINTAPYTVTATVAGDSVDNNLGDNVWSWTIEADTCAPAAGANPYISSCLCGTLNTPETTTICSKGVTEWRLNPLSVTNGTVQFWDELTGEHDFQYIDPSQNITFTWNLYCVEGVNEYLIAQNVSGTIRAQIANKEVFDHKRYIRSYAELSPSDILTLQEQEENEDVVIADFCWDVLVNSNGDVTSGTPLNCDPEKNTKVIHQVMLVDYNPAQPSLGLTFPSSPEKGDMLIVSFTNASVYYTYSGVSWVPTVSYFVVPIEVEVTGLEPNRRVVITLSNGNTIQSNLF